jgi:uncharacterized 2Fe-2S/4Fe-4S cluster protein (DUF4445 family)
VTALAKSAGRIIIAEHTIRFEPSGKTVPAPTGALLSEVARQVGIDLNMPCGGQGRCGRCAVIVEDGAGVRRRSTLRLTSDDLAAGYALACQTVVEGDAVITIPPQEKIERRLVTDKTAKKVVLPFVYDPLQHQSMRLLPLTLDPPSMVDQTDDWSRLKRAVASARMPSLGQWDSGNGNWLSLKETVDTGDGVTELVTDLPTLNRLGTMLRENDWAVTAVIEMDTWDRSGGPARLVDLLPPNRIQHLWGAAVDIGTTTVSLYLVDLLTGEVATKAAEYNGQIRRGEDVISRIIYASKDGGLGELQSLVVSTINELLQRAARRAKISPSEIYKMVVAGNSTMIHLLLGLPPSSIRLEPFVTTINHPPPVLASQLDIDIYPQATVDCLPGVASYVGADISSGVIGSQMCDSSALTLFLDVGTNGEMVLGDCDWLISCACSAGPAFEGAGVQNGMRATVGAIEEVWINSESYEPTCRVIPNPRLEAKSQSTPPVGVCGSGLISLLSEMFITGVIDKAGNLNFDLGSPRIRQGEHGPEYVIAWGNQTEHGHDIIITKVDIDNLIRAKGAIYAGFTVLAQSVGIDLGMVERVLIGGSFGQYINIEKAIQIGLLPDLPWDRFHFLGNTALRGALLALLSREHRQQIGDAAQRMTYLELSADNSFYEAFTSALFLPHTDLEQFPSVAELLADRETQSVK